MKKTLSLLLVLILCATLCCPLLFGCDKKEVKENPIVEITMTTGETIRMELYPDVAPITVANFLRYVKDGFFDGMVFHRIIQNFMIQTGGFTKIEIQGTPYPLEKEATYPPIKGEFSSNGIKNDLKHTVGVVSMARFDGDCDSATAGFFICSADSPHLDGEYAAFGKVTDQESLEVVMRLEKAQTQTGYLLQEIDGKLHGSAENYVPVDPPQIKTVRLLRE